jgi:hypothetical protein
VLAFPACSWRALAFSAGGDGGRRLRELLASWQLFRHTLAGGISLTPLTLSVPPFELFSDLLNRRAHGHGWVTE